MAKTGAKSTKSDLTNEYPHQKGIIANKRIPYSGDGKDGREDSNGSGFKPRIVTYMQKQSGATAEKVRIYKRTEIGI